MGFSCQCMGFYSMQWRSTGPSSLLFNAYYLCRLQFPLCWLYLQVLDWDFPKEGKPLTRVTAFQSVVQMNTKSFLGANGLNVVAAILILTYAIFSYFRSHEFGDDADAEERISAGAVLLMQEQRRYEQEQQPAPVLESNDGLDNRPSPSPLAAS